MTLAEVTLPCGCVPCDRHLDALVTARDIGQYREVRDEEEWAEVDDPAGEDAARVRLAEKEAKNG